jgi:Asp-tRNA(Asn)/Glu-tRNA(Gln) amidotransferase B subunit
MKLIRQIESLETGKKLRQETRLWEAKDNKTYVMRSKEEAGRLSLFS